MLSIKALLNPKSPERHEEQHNQTLDYSNPSPLTIPCEAGPSSSNRTPPSDSNLRQLSNINKQLRPQGTINYPPFENLDEQALRSITPFCIQSLGRIGSVGEHIPYHSTKKDFFAKTGRGSIEAFQYAFQHPETGKLFTIMWDYNVGLVRMTPFFKSLGYSKTKPSQMLDKNPGLRNISPSITGGSVSAQGYWMPYRCARAICATFCYSIAGALIPLFGPDFPAQCYLPNNPQYEEMKIERSIIELAAQDTERFRTEQAALDRQDQSYEPLPLPLPKRANRMSSTRSTVTTKSSSNAENRTYHMPPGPRRQINPQISSEHHAHHPHPYSRGRVALSPARRALVSGRPPGSIRNRVVTTGSIDHQTSRHDITTQDLRRIHSEPLQSTRLGRRLRSMDMDTTTQTTTLENSFSYLKGSTEGQEVNAATTLVDMFQRNKSRYRSP